MLGYSYRMSSLEHDLRDFEGRRREIEADVTRADRELKLAEAEGKNESILAVHRQELKSQLERLATSRSDIEDIRQEMQRGR